MKIIDEKGKLFGLVNIVDLMVLVAVLAATAAIGVKLFAAPIAEYVAPSVPMTTVFRVRGASDLLVNEINRNPLEGKKLVAGTEFIDAEVLSCEIEDYVVQVMTDDGRIVDATDPTKKDIVITVVSTVARGTATPKIGNQEVRAGRTFIFKTVDFEMIANIDSVVIDG